MYVKGRTLRVKLAFLPGLLKDIGTCDTF